MAIKNKAERIKSAKAARKQLEGKLGRSVISSAKASDHLLPKNTEKEK